VDRRGYRRQQLGETQRPPELPTCGLGGQRGRREPGGVGGGESGPASPEETSEQPTLERLHQRGLPSPRVTKELQLDSRLEVLRGSELLDEEPSVSVLDTEGREL
jgi:hypothetical protein